MVGKYCVVVHFDGRYGWRWFLRGQGVGRFEYAASAAIFRDMSMKSMLYSAITLS